MNDLISIIIPIYNVKDYLEECLNNVLNQTYNNLEIILVDDGSSDGSESICDIYKEKDSRIIVIHQDNSGPSAARNNGLKISKGKYISFVDADDYPFLDMIEKLHYVLVSNSADIACCEYTSNVNKKRKNIVSIHEFTSYEAISHLLDSERYRCYPWNKLFKRDLFDFVSFPEGKFYEDIITSYNLMKEAKKIVYTDEILYFYRIRPISTTQSIFSKKNYDMLEAIELILEDVQNNNTADVNAVRLGYIFYYLSFINKMFKTSDERDTKVENHLRELIINNINFVLKDRYNSLINKIQYIMIAISLNLYRKAIRFIYRVK